LGSARNRPTGKELAEQIGHTQPRSQSTFDLGGHLDQRPIALDPEQVRHAHRALLAASGQVVSEEIHDHDVLGLRLGIGGQAGGKDVVFNLGVPPAYRALPRPGKDAPTGEFKKQLRRAAQDLAVSRIDVGPELNRLTMEKVVPEGKRASNKFKGQRGRVVDLVDIPFVDGLLDASKSLCVFVPRQAKAGVSNGYPGGFARWR